MSKLQAEQYRLMTVSLVVLAALGIAAALHLARPAMVPFVLAVFIAYLVAPVVDFGQKYLRLPRPLSMLLALLLTLGFLMLLALLITTSTRGLIASADIYRERLAGFVERGFSILDRLGVDLGQEPLLQGIRQLPLVDLARRTAGTAFEVVTTSGLVLIFVVYLIIGGSQQEPPTGFYAEIHLKIRRYLGTKFLTSATTGILVGFILSLFGLDLALVFGVMAFLLNFIPSIGSMVATLLPLPIAIIQFDDPWKIVGVVVLPGLVQFTIGNVIEPLVMGERLDLHPVTVLLSLIFWGLLWGIVGMFLAVPITAVIRIVLGRLDTTRPMAELLAGRLPQAAAPE
jgi:AI-2 transport protein TqsA